MKPERIQFAPALGGNDNVSEPDWKATVTVGRKFELAPSSQMPFLAGVLQRAQNLPNPPKVVFAVEANPGERGGFLTSVDLEWSDGGPMTDVEVGFARWVNGFYDHLNAALTAAN